MKNIRKIEVFLALFWFIDAILQFQSNFFSAKLANKVVLLAATGQPVFVAGLIHLAVHFILINPALFNLCAAVIQLTIAWLIFFKNTTRYGLIISIVWGLGVWIFAEGLGGIFSAKTSIMMGAPGAAIFYVLIALAILPLKLRNNTQRQTKTPYWLAVAWLVIWVGGGVYQLLPFQSSNNVSSMIAANEVNAPVWVAGIDRSEVAGLEKLANSNGGLRSSSGAMSMTGSSSTQTYSRYDLFNVGLALIEMFVGIGVVLGSKLRRSALVIGVILSAIFWVGGQNFGSFYSGLAPDLNSGPLYILLAYTIAGCVGLDRFTARYKEKIQAVLIGDHKMALESVVVEPDQ